MKNSGSIRIGIGGWVFPPWRGAFYPAGLRQAEELAYASRKVTAIDTAGKRYEATTGVNGGFTMQVPEGTYRLEVELRPGEKVTKQPGETKVNKGDLDLKRDFVISAGG